MNSIIRSNYLNTEYQIPNSKQYFDENVTKTNVFDFYETICSENLWNYLFGYLNWLFEYPNTIWGPKKPNTKYKVYYLVQSFE